MAAPKTPSAYSSVSHETTPRRPKSARQNAHDAAESEALTGILARPGDEVEAGACIGPTVEPVGIFACGAILHLY